jgi:hypothetical protein
MTTAPDTDQDELAGLVDPIVTDDSHGLPQGAWSRIIVISMSGCDYDFISDPRAVADCLSQLVNEIGMRPFGEPISFTFGQGALYGNTGIQVGIEAIGDQHHKLIETSNITVHANHAVPEHTAFVVINTCSECNVPAAVAFVSKAFGATKTAVSVNALCIAPPLDD